MWFFIEYLILVGILFFLNLIANEYFSKHTEASKSIFKKSILQGGVISIISFIITEFVIKF